MIDLLQEVADHSEIPPGLESKFYKAVDAYSPKDIGYTFTVAYQDPDFHSSSIETLVRSFNSLPVLVIENSHQKPQGKLRIVSPAHGRSTELDVVGELKLDSELSLYPALSEKGNTTPVDMGQAYLSFDPATGIRIRGLLMGDAKMILSYPEKCRRIAAAGLPSERIVAAFIATHVPFAEAGKANTWNTPRPFDLSLREDLLDLLGDTDIKLRIDEGQRRMWGGDTVMNNRRSDRLIKEGEIIIFVRAMQVNERIKDTLTADQENTRNLCAPALQFVNSQDPENYQFLPLSADIDYLDFLQKWLPKQMGFHLGSWTKKGFVHGWAHGQNWTLAGTLIDDDSAREKSDFDLDSLEGQRQYRGYQVYDIIRSFEAIVEMFDSQGEFAQTGSERVSTSKKMHEALEAFLLEYIKVVFSHLGSMKEKIAALLELLNHELPNPHFDAMRDGDERETISISKQEDKFVRIWAEVLKRISPA